MYETIDILLTGRGIDKFGNLPVCRTDELDAVGSGYGYLSVGQLEDILHIMDGIIMWAVSSQSQQVSVQSAHPQVAVAVVAQTVHMVIL